MTVSSESPLSQSAISSSAVVVVDPRLGGVLPAAATRVLRTASRAYAGADLPADLVALFGSELNAEPAPEPGVLAREAADGPVVLLTSDTEDPAAAALVASGARVITTPAPPGAELLSAVAVMNRLRSPGGCPWDAAQTHDSLRQYLVEETYELLDAIADADRVAMREELGCWPKRMAISMPSATRSLIRSRVINSSSSPG